MKKQRLRSVAMLVGVFGVNVALVTETASSGYKVHCERQPSVLTAAAASAEVLLEPRTYTTDARRRVRCAIPRPKCPATRGLGPR